MPRQELKVRVDLAFSQFLDCHQFREYFYIIDKAHFGNSMLGYKSNKFCICFVDDRGEVDLRIAGPQAPGAWEVGVWHWFSSVLGFLGYPWGALHGASDAEMATVLSTEHDRVAEAFSEDKLASTSRALEQLTKQPRPSSLEVRKQKQ